MSSEKEWTLEEIKTRQDSDEGSVWLTIRGKVYEVTSFLKAHPGGPEILKEYSVGSGEDATEEFEQRHSEDAKKKLPRFYRGVVKDYVAPVEEDNEAVQTVFYQRWGPQLLLVIVAIFLYVQYGQ